ncbi:hypothetical protein PQX77_009440 [Marasmius sp. AFHP31]|nr:hypothetical protein PQX77_009440 [Marasmius sp. AFHP31]
MYRLSRSPRTDTRSFSDDSYEDSNSIDEVEATLNNLDDELDDTEQAVSTWSSNSSNPPGQAPSSYSSTGYGSYTGTGTYSYTATPSGFSGSQSFSSLPTLLGSHSPILSQIPRYPPPSNDPRIRLSHITERTERTESRPVSGVSSQGTTIPARPRSAFIPRSPGGHGRSTTDPGDRDLPPPGRANELIGLFEATSSTGSGSRSSSPTKLSATSSSYTRSQTPTATYSTLMSPPLRPSTTTGASTFTSTGITPTTLTSFTPTVTQTGTATGSGTTERAPGNTLQRPEQTAPRSPLSSVRNIVALWKERTPTKGHARGGSVSSASVSPTPESRQLRRDSEDPVAGPSTRPGEGDGLFDLRRRASGRMSGEGDRQSAASGNSVGIDVGELSRFLGGNTNETPLHLGNLYYLNVHTSPPFLWQRCQALLFRNTLLLSWIAPTSAGERAPMGRAVVQLDLMNCLTVESALSLSHPRARDDVGAIAAREQDAASRSRGESDAMVDSLVPFWMVYGDGVERLACESLVERQRWIGRIWEAINNPPTPLSRTPSLTPSFTRSRSPTGSIRTIMSVESRSSVSTASSSASAGSRSTVFVPPIAEIPEIDDMYASESGRSGRTSPSKASSASSGKYVSFSDEERGVRRRPSVFMSSHHDRTVDDTVISGEDYIYPGDSRAITGRRSSTRLRRSGSMTDLGNDFQTNRRYVGSSGEEEEDRFLSASSGTPRSSRYSSADSYDSRTRSYTETFTPSGSGTYTAPYMKAGVSETTGYTGYTQSGTGSWTGTNGRTVTGITSDTRGPTSTLSYRGTESASMLGDSHDSATYTGTYSYTESPYTRTTAFTGSPYTATNTLTYASSPYTRSTSPYSSSTPYTYTPTTTTTSLSRTREVRRRARTSSFGHSSSGRSGTSGSGSGYQPSGSDETSDKENGSMSGTGPLSGNRSSETGYDICPSSDLSELTGRTITYTSTSIDTTIPLPSIPASERDSGDENFATAPSASEYASARSPSIASFESLPSIPSLYSTASEGSLEDYKTASEPATTRSQSTRFQTAELCPSELVSIPSEEGTPRASVSEIELLTDVEEPSIVERIPSSPATVPSLISTMTSSPRPASVSISTAPSVSTVRPEDVPLPPSVASEYIQSSPSPSTVTHISLPPPSTETTTETSLILTRSPSVPSESALLETIEDVSSIHFTESIESAAPPTSTEPPISSVAPTPTEASSSVISDSSPYSSTPYSSTSSSELQSLQVPTSVAPTAPTAVRVRRRTLTTESSLTPTIPPTLPSTTVPSEPASSPPASPRWASETNISFDSSQLLPSPSMRSVALQEGPDHSFETSFLRATASQSSIDRISTIPETPTVTSVTPASRRGYGYELSPVLPPPPTLELASEATTPSSLVFTESLLGVRSSLRSVSPTSVSSELTSSSSPIELEGDEGEDGATSVATYPSLLTTPRASRAGTVVSRAGSLASTTPSISVSISTPHGDRPSTRSTLRTIPSESSPFLGSIASYSIEGGQPSEPKWPDYSRELNELIEELRRYDQNRGDENREVGHTLNGLQSELREIADFLHRPPTRYAEERVGPSSSGSVITRGGVSLTGPRGPREPVYSVDLPPVRTVSGLSRATSSASSISFLSSHHSEDWELYGTSRADSPVPTFISDGSSPSLTSSSFTSTSSAPSPSTISDSLQVPASVTPTPPPISTSPSTISTVVPPSAPNPIPLLSEIREQVRALWDGQLSTNHLLDQLRERPTPAFDNTPLLDRLNRVEGLLHQLAEQSRQPPPQPAPVIVDRPVMMPQPPPPPTTDDRDAAETISDLDIDELLRNWSSGRPALAPMPRHQVPSGPTLAQQLDQILSQAERPTGPPVHHPEAVRSIRSLSIIVPGEGTPSPPIDITISLPDRVYTAPPPSSYMHIPHPATRRQQPAVQEEPEDQPHAQQPAAPPPVSRQQAPPPATPITEMADPSHRHEEATPTPTTMRPLRHPGPPPQPIPYPGTEAGRRTAPPTVLGGRTSPSGPSWYYPSGHTEVEPQGPIIAPGGVPPPGAFGTTPTGQQRPPPPPGQSGAGQGAQGGYAYVPMPSGPVVVPGLDRLLEQNDAIRDVIVNNGMQTDELLRYMSDLNRWLEQDVTDRQRELRGVLANISELRGQMEHFMQGGRPRSMDERSGTTTSTEEEEGVHPPMSAPVPSMPGFPIGFFPHPQQGQEPPVIPHQATGFGQEPPIIPGVVPQTTGGVGGGMGQPQFPQPLVIHQPGGHVSAPVIPMDGLGQLPMGMPVPHTAVPMPGAEAPFIPDQPHLATIPQLSVQRMPSSDGSGSSSSSTSSSGTSHRSRRSSRSHRTHPSRHPSTRSRRTHSRTHSPHTDILPVPPPGSPPLVTITPTMRPGSPRHPDVSGAPAPIVINMPPSGHPGQPGVVPPMMIPPQGIPVTAPIYPVPPPEVELEAEATHQIDGIDGTAVEGVDTPVLFLILLDIRDTIARGHRVITEGIDILVVEAVATLETVTLGLHGALLEVGVDIVAVDLVHEADTIHPAVAVAALASHMSVILRARSATKLQ